MKKTAYLKPLIEVTQIETEQFIAGSATGTDVEGLGVDNTETEEEGRARLLFLFDED